MRAPLPDPDPELRERIVAALERLRNATSVMRELGSVRYAVICQVAEEEGIALAAPRPGNRRGNHIGPSETAAIAAALKLRREIGPVARQFGRSLATVRAIAKLYRIQLLPDRRYLAPDKRGAIAAALKAGGGTARRIARSVGKVSHVTVARIAREEGIPLQRRRHRS